MNFEPVAEENYKKFQASKIRIMIDEFNAADCAIAKIKFAEDYKTPNSAYVAIWNALKRMSLPHIKVQIRDGELYLINLNKIKEKG